MLFAFEHNFGNKAVPVFGHGGNKFIGPRLFTECLFGLSAMARAETVFPLLRFRSIQGVEKEFFFFHKVAAVFERGTKRTSE